MSHDKENGTFVLFWNLPSNGLYLKISIHKSALLIDPFIIRIYMLQNWDLFYNLGLLVDQSLAELTFLTMQGYLVFFYIYFVFICYSKTCLRQPLKKKTINGFQDRLSLYADQKYGRMFQESILQYFWPSFIYLLSLWPLFCLFLSGRLRQVYCSIWIRNKKGSISNA